MQNKNGKAFNPGNDHQISQQEDELEFKKMFEL